MIETYIFLGICIIYINCYIRETCFKKETEEYIDPCFVKDMSCAICLEELSTVKYITKTSCNHYFCTPCLLEWLHLKKSCPMCMKELFN